MNGLRFIAEAFHSKEFWHNGDRVEIPSYNDLMRTLKKNHIVVKRPGQLQEKMIINGAVIEVLYPEPVTKTEVAAVPGEDLNNRSMVLRISYGGTSILFRAIWRKWEKTGCWPAPENGSKATYSFLLITEAKPPARTHSLKW